MTKAERSEAVANHLARHSRAKQFLKCNGGPPPHTPRCASGHIKDARGSAPHILKGQLTLLYVQGVLLLVPIVWTTRKIKKGYVATPITLKVSGLAFCVFGSCLRAA